MYTPPPATAGRKVKFRQFEKQAVSSKVSGQLDCARLCHQLVSKRTSTSTKNIKATETEYCVTCIIFEEHYIGRGQRFSPRKEAVAMLIPRLIAGIVENTASVSE
jgi:hypothetical protein